MSYYLIFEQKLKKSSAEFEFQENSDIKLSHNDKGENILVFDVGQNLLASVIVNCNETNATTNKNFYKYFHKHVKNHDSSELMGFVKELKEGFAKEGEEFLKKSAYRDLTCYPIITNDVNMFSKSLKEFEAFVQYAINNKLVIKHIYA